MASKTLNVTNTPTSEAARPDRGPKPPSEAARAAGRAHAAGVMAERKAAGLSARPDPIENAQNDPTSLRKAATAKCADCVCWRNGDPAPAWRIGNCTTPNCPLHPVRPYQHLHGSRVPKALVQQFDASAGEQPDMQPKEDESDPEKMP